MLLVWPAVKGRDVSVSIKGDYIAFEVKLSPIEYVYNIVYNYYKLLFLSKSLHSYLYFFDSFLTIIRIGAQKYLVKANVEDAYVKNFKSPLAEEYDLITIIFASY
jgi:hypothetical protein